MNFKEGEVLYFDKPLKWTSFAVVNKIRYHICRKLGVKKIKLVQLKTTVERYREVFLALGFDLPPIAVPPRVRLRDH